MSPAVIAGLLLLAVLWGSAFPMIKVGLDGLSVGHLTLARHLVASLAFVPFLLLRRRRLWPQRRDLPYFLLLGLLGITIYHLALNFGELGISAGAASLIIATTPAITALVAVLFAGEKMTPLGWLGSALSFSGVALIALGDDSALRFDPHALLVLLAAVVTALYFVLQKPMFARYRAVEVTAFSTWAGTLPLLLFLPGFAAGVAGAGPYPLAAALYIGLFPSAVAYTIFAYALSKAPASLVTVYLYTVPVFGVLFSWLLLGEVPSWLTLIGGVVALGGIVVVNRARLRRPRRPARPAL